MPPARETRPSEHPLPGSAAPTRGDAPTPGSGRAALGAHPKPVLNVNVCSRTKMRISITNLEGLQQPDPNGQFSE